MKFRQLAIVVGVLTVLGIAAGPASAEVSIAANLSWQAGAPGQTGLPGGVLLANTNSPPHEAETNLLTDLRLVPGCGTLATLGNLCSAPQPGVLSISSAIGRADSSCAGTTFTISAPDAIGAVTLTPPSGPVILRPDNGAPGRYECIVVFDIAVLKAPAIDTRPEQAGTQTNINIRASTQSVTSGIASTSISSLFTTINKAAPTLAGQAARNGSTISDTVVVGGPPGAPTPTGTVTFSVYIGGSSCGGYPLATSVNTVTAGSATSNDFAISQPGIYRFETTYSGDANYAFATTACNAANQNIAFAPGTSVADFDATSTTDRSVYRNGAWYVHNQPTVFFGLPGDIPVPADYDGDGDTDRAVFRNGAWHVHNQSTVSFGLAGHTPVPGDYDGDGDADRAVYNPSTGGWYVEGLPTVFLGGAAGDIPVPGDYNGDGDLERAVYRAGAWYVEGQAPVFLGAAGDIPVPGDYDANGTTDRAVYRNGAWHVHNQPTVFFGLPGDVPEPGDYDGSGSTDRAVYRNGGWYVQNQTTVFFGFGSDIPLPLPQAIYRASLGS